MIFTHYDNYKGGINNLQVSTIIYCGNVIKTFTSTKGLAHNRAEKFLESIIIY